MDRTSHENNHSSVDRTPKGRVTKCHCKRKRLVFYLWKIHKANWNVSKKENKSQEVGCTVTANGKQEEWPNTWSTSAQAQNPFDRQDSLNFKIKHAGSHLPNFITVLSESEWNPIRPLLFPTVNIPGSRWITTSKATNDNLLSAGSPINLWANPTAANTVGHYSESAEVV